MADESPNDRALTLGRTRTRKLVRRADLSADEVDTSLISEATHKAKQVLGELADLEASLTNYKGKYAKGLTMDEQRALERLSTLETEVALLKQASKDFALMPKVELMITKVIEPINSSIAKIEHSIADLATNISQTSEDSQTAFQAVNEFIKNEEKRKVKESEDKTVGASVKRWGAVAGAVGAVFSLIIIMLGLLQAYLKAHGF